MCQEVLFRLKEACTIARSRTAHLLTTQYADFTRSLIGQLTAAYQQSTVAAAKIQPLFALEAMDETCSFWTLVQKCIDHWTPGGYLCFACSKLYWEQNSGLLMHRVLSSFVSQIWTRYKKLWVIQHWSDFKINSMYNTVYGKIQTSMLLPNRWCKQILSQLWESVALKEC